MKMKKFISILSVITISTVFIFGCGKTEGGDQGATEASSEASSEEEVVLEEDEEYHGFVLDESYESKLLDSTIYSFTHKVSGAKLVYIKNSDPECSFDIMYHTPYVDETDTNHIFEHSIIASSDKYPSKDIFFDIANKSYNTFVNAQTSFQTTRYPVASMSQDQLMLLMDVYMSCMVAPHIMQNENFFKREAIRYELYDKDDEISINGTVFAEDTGFLTNHNDECISNVLDALYPGEYASNMLGRAEYHYADLTYEHTKETYERCYHFDNSIITLYGNLDIDKFLEFLDTEYLSKEPVHGTDLSMYEDPLTEEGNIEEVMTIPAYQGDTVKNNSIITYAIDLQGADYKTLIEWNLLCDILNRSSSCMNEELINRGIQNPVSVSVLTTSAKPFLLFDMHYAEKDQMKQLKSIADYTFKTVSEEGVSKELVDSTLKSTELETLLLRNNANVGVNLSQTIGEYWVATGKTDYFKLFEEVIDELSADTEQKTFKVLCDACIEPRRSALIAHVPTPGLAEKHDQEMAQYLKEYKASLSDEEVQKLIDDTLAFDEWNKSEFSNTDFTIDPSILPEIETPDYEVSKEGDITVFQSKIDAGNAGAYNICFDLSGMTRDEIVDLMAYMAVLFETETDKYDSTELDILESEYLDGFGYDLMYPGEKSGEFNRPMLVISWYSMTDDFEKSIDLVLNILTSTNVEDKETISYILSRDVDKYDMSRGNAYSVAKQYANAGTGTTSDTYKFQWDCGGQILYDSIKDLVSDGEYAERFGNARSKAFTGKKLIVKIVSNEGSASNIKDAAIKALSQLPDKPADAKGKYELPVIAKKTGIIVETSQNNTVMIGSFYDDEDFRGAYIPFVYAANDKYTVPKIRFQLGAYSAANSVQASTGVIVNTTYSDPNIKESIEVIEGLDEYLESAELSEDDLKGYILNAYGDALYPKGLWTDAMRAINRYIYGINEDQYIGYVSDIRNCDMSIQKEAATAVGDVIDNSFTATTGNEESIKADQKCFDEIIRFKKN